MAGEKSNAYQASFLKLTFNALGIANIASSAAASPSTSIWVALHIADPGPAGGQATSEATYGGYARIVTDRTTGSNGWAISGTSPTQASPNSVITFPQCTSSTTIVITNFSVGVSSSGAGTLLYSGTVTQNISINTNVTPSLTTASLITED